MDISNIIIKPEYSLFDWLSNSMITFFLSLAIIDYVVYFVLFLYVFVFIVMQPQSLLKRLFSLLIIILFTAIRSVFIPLLINSIPWQWKPELPNSIMSITFYSCTISYIVFFNLPVLACIYFLLKFGTRGDKLPTGIVDLEKGEEASTVVVMMPIYNEELIPLMRAIESAIRSDYPSHKLHLILGFDDHTESELYCSVLVKLRVLTRQLVDDFKSSAPTADGSEDELFPPRLDLLVEGVKVTVCRFPHGGKSATQGRAYDMINSMYGNDKKSTMVMFIDSDVILHDNAIYNFVSTLRQNQNMKAVTGYITCRTSDRFNWLHYLQDAEYLEGQMFARSLEALCGSVTCLPGALTMLRLDALIEVAPLYFTDLDKRASLHYHRYYLGEDRYMTHLLMELSQKAYTIGLCGASRCKTDAPDSWSTLIKQRRRWYLGALINETYMLTTPRLWKTMPLLLGVKLFDYSSGSLSWLFMIYLIGIVKSIVPLWTIMVFLPCLIFKYLVLSINASLMNRSKVFLSFPVFFFIAPVFKLYCTLYSIWTWSTRSWGGPRTDRVQEKQTKAQLLDQIVMDKTRPKRNKKLMKQIKKRAEILNFNLKQRNEMWEIQSNSTHSKSRKSKPKDAISLKMLLPFPYEVEVLDGGDFDLDNQSEALSSNESMLSMHSIDSKFWYQKCYKGTSYSLDKLSLFKVEQLSACEKERVRMPDRCVSREESMMSMELY